MLATVVTLMFAAPGDVPISTRYEEGEPAAGADQKKFAAFPLTDDVRRVGAPAMHAG